MNKIKPLLFPERLINPFGYFFGYFLDTFYPIKCILFLFFLSPIILMIFFFSNDLKYLNAVVGEVLNNSTHPFPEILPFSLSEIYPKFIRNYRSM